MYPKIPLKLRQLLTIIDVAPKMSITNHMIAIQGGLGVGIAAIKVEVGASSIGEKWL